MYNDEKVFRKIFSEYFFTIYLKMYHKLKQNDKNIYKLILIKIVWRWGFVYECIPEVMTFKECQNILKVGKNTLLDLIHTEQIQAFKIGNRWKIPKQSVIEFIQYR